MKEWFDKIWHDPVWSKVISAFIVALLGVVYSLIRGWLSDTETIPQALMFVFTYKANVWLTIGVVMLVLAIIGVVKKVTKKKDRIPQPPFVRDFTKGRYQNQVWSWRWKWSPTHHFYYITDLSVVCPVCNEGLLSLEFSMYRCAKCNAEIPYSLLNTTNDTVTKQILEDARQQYDYCAEYIGKMPSGIYRNIGS